MIGSSSDQSRQTWLFSLLYVLALAGYPVMALSSTILGIENSYFSYTFRAFVVLLSVITIGTWVRHRYPYTLDLTIGIFFSLYLFRLVYDASIANIPDARFALLVFVATCAIPGVALGLVAPLLSERVTAICMLFVGVATSMGALLGRLLGLSTGAVGYTESDRLSFEALNPISLGYSGVYTLIAAFVCWRYLPTKYRPLIAFAAGAGLISLILSGSRGPVVAVIACLAMLAVIGGRWFVLSMVVALGAAYVMFSGSGEFRVVDRFTGVGTDMSSMARFQAQAAAIEQFLESPMTGHAYVETISYSYPHNLILESALALGVVGLGLFLVLMVRACRAVYKSLRRGELMFPMIMISALVNSMLSGNLWQGAEFWLTLIIMLGSARFQHFSAPPPPLPEGRPGMALRERAL